MFCNFMFGDFYYSTNEYDIRELKKKKKLCPLTALQSSPTV